jgi:Uncharacterized conserved protein
LKEGFYLRLLGLLSDKKYRHAYAKIGRLSLDMDVADDSYKRAKGLMYRKKMQEARGMLFIFNSERRYSFWMLNMQFSIDILWLDRNMRIVDITRNVEPAYSILGAKNYSPSKPAMYVIETCSGFADSSGIKPGYKIRLEFKRSAP